MTFCRLLFLVKFNISEKIVSNSISLSDGLDPDQARQYVGPDLDPNCLQRLSADDTSG